MFVDVNITGDIQRNSFYEISCRDFEYEILLKMSTYKLHKASYCYALEQIAFDQSKTWCLGKSFVL